MVLYDQFEGTGEETIMFDIEVTSKKFERNIFLREVSRVTTTLACTVQVNNSIFHCASNQVGPLIAYMYA
jgi:hypothetical protein